jgi:subtilase family serine protease
MVRRLAVGSTAGVMILAALGGSVSAASSRAALPGSVPSWATSANFVSASNPKANVGFRVYLGWRDQAGAEAVARSVSDPRSASYGKYVTPAQFRQRFAPAQSQVTAVQSWLRGQGFSVNYTPTNNHFVQAEGTVAQAAAAFGTSFGQYRYSGKVVRSPSKALSVPSSINFVSGVVGLDESALFVKPNKTPDAPPSPAFVNAPPCSAYWNEKNTATTHPNGVTLPDAYGGPNPFAPCGWTPAQLRGAYGTAGLIAAGNDGTGQTVAIIDAYASPTIVSDVNTWSTRRGIPTLAANQFSQVVPPGIFNKPQNNRQDPQGWYGEETLDVEAVHAMAPGAKIVYVGAPNNFQDLDAAMNHVVDKGLARIVTNSYGFSTEALPSGFIKPLNDTFIQAAAEGIGVYFSSGDSGDEAANHGGVRTVDWPASSPWVTAVGGTSLAVGASNNYLFETGWLTGRSNLVNGAWSPTPPGNFTTGSGGGTSRLFAQPTYQAGVVPNSIATSNGGTFKGRAVPDVGIVGDPNTGFLVGQTQTFPDGSVRYSEFRLGGTSLSSPLFAGIMALADQAAGHAHGFANPALYAKAGTSAYRDIVQPVNHLAVARVDFTNTVDPSAGYIYSLRTLDNWNLTIHTVAGYDDVTGMGSPNGASFINALK